MSEIKIPDCKIEQKIMQKEQDLIDQAFQDLPRELKYQKCDIVEICKHISDALVDVEMCCDYDGFRDITVAHLERALALLRKNYLGRQFSSESLPVE